MTFKKDLSKKVVSKKSLNSNLFSKKKVLTYARAYIEVPPY